MKIVYFVSSTHPYERAIYPGVGPSFANALGWPVAKLNDIASIQFDVGIIDNRLEVGDVRDLQDFLTVSYDRRSPVFFRVSDPDMPRAKNQNIRFIFDQANRPGVHYVSAYQPEGALLEFSRTLRSSRLIELPYPYDPSRELEIDFASRIRGVFVSGAASKRIYPLRHRIRSQRHWNPFLRRRVFDLPHPGYPEQLEQPRHMITHDRYVRLASCFTHFFLCPSIYQIELMKFVECAYAGCVPIGLPAKSILPFVSACFSNYSGRPFSTFSNLRLALIDLQQRALEYRSVMRKIRSTHTLRETFERDVRVVVLDAR